jgi:hypothetical protein
LRPFRASADPLESDWQQLVEVEVPRGMHDFYANDHLALAHVQDDIVRHSSVENILRTRIETQIQKVCTFMISTVLCEYRLPCRTSSTWKCFRMHDLPCFAGTGSPEASTASISPSLASIDSILPHAKLAS